LGTTLLHSRNKYQEQVEKYCNILRLLHILQKPFSYLNEKLFFIFVIKEHQFIPEYSLSILLKQTENFLLSDIQTTTG
jgi:hypothetical protein